MHLYPAIDLRGGRCVRLVQGDYDRETVYGDDPVAQAVAFADAGAPWIHVVDLDAARSGIPENRDVVAAIAAAVSVPVQTGGGIRDDAAADALLDAGVARVVVGTAALEDPAFVRRLAGRAHVAVGLDVRGDEVAVRGWEQASGRSLLDVLREFEDCGVDAVVVTQIDVDGTLEGPDVPGYERLLAATSMAVVASGGVGDASHVRTLAAMVGPGERRLDGVIVGRAIYDGRVTVAEALDACRVVGSPAGPDDGGA